MGERGQRVLGSPRRQQPPRDLGPGHGQPRLGLRDRRDVALDVGLRIGQRLHPRTYAWPAARLGVEHLLKPRAQRRHTRLVQGRDQGAHEVAEKLLAVGLKQCGDLVGHGSRFGMRGRGDIARRRDGRAKRFGDLAAPVVHQSEQAFGHGQEPPKKLQRQGRVLLGERSHDHRPLEFQVARERLVASPMHPRAPVLDRRQPLGDLGRQVIGANLAGQFHT